MTNDEIRELEINYLVNSGFIENYTKKLIIPSDIDTLYEDYVQECWLAILELPTSKIAPLYKKGNHSDDFYELRNYISMVIRNTVRSTSSYAYKKLKRHKEVEYQQDSVRWEVLENTIADESEVHYE